MATIAQHNNLVKCMVGGQNHFRHILTSGHVNNMAYIEKRYPITRLPVCEHCEKLAMWGHNPSGERIAICRNCGTITANPMPYSEYLANGYDLDGTAFGRDIIQKEVQARSLIL